jgi:hypothetical protein
MAVLSDAELVPPASAVDEGGSMLFPGRVPVGTQLGSAADNVQPSMSKCLEACRRRSQCNGVWFCEAQASGLVMLGSWGHVQQLQAARSLRGTQQLASSRAGRPPRCARFTACACGCPQGGCTNAMYNLSAPAGGCQLVEQEATRSGTGRPILLVQAPNFVGGVAAGVRGVRGGCEGSGAAWDPCARPQALRTPAAGFASPPPRRGAAAVPPPPGAWLPGVARPGLLVPPRPHLPRLGVAARQLRAEGGAA